MSPVRSPVMSTVRSPVMSPVWSPVRSLITGPVRSPVMSPVRSCHRSGHVNGPVMSTVRSPVRSLITAPVTGQQSSSPVKKKNSVFFIELFSYSSLNTSSSSRIRHRTRSSSSSSSHRRGSDVILEDLGLIAADPHLGRSRSRHRRKRGRRQPSLLGVDTLLPVIDRSGSFGLPWFLCPPILDKWFRSPVGIYRSGHRSFC
ncbi:hypothetical protein DPMN_097328 [Dreissena polymorpha]|uniref:Uncharacterized protein n=1 Tax=Dreissena polymorpha TaxID=45954 RepID=A0A9D4LBL1_DREPO|nr:hypothetical protein DPMN_097328 [Dreissena polymorpha]